MPELAMLVAVAAAATLGFTIAGVAGFGGGVVILPVLVWALGPREAIPILSIGQCIASAVRFWMHRREASWPVVCWFAVGSVPIAALAGWLYVQTPADLFGPAGAYEQICAALHICSYAESLNMQSSHY